MPATQHQSAPATLDDAIYAELKRVARHHLRAHATNATLSTTDLLHDAYLKLGASDKAPWESRAHFFGSASRAMRQVLVDYARKRSAVKRGGGLPPVTLATGDDAFDVRFDELLVLDEALDQLRAVSPRLCRLVELRFFAGLNEEEIAQLLEVTSRTVRRDWTKARLFLARALARD